MNFLSSKRNSLQKSESSDVARITALEEALAASRAEVADLKEKLDNLNDEEPSIDDEDSISLTDRIRYMTIMGNKSIGLKSSTEINRVHHHLTTLNALTSCYHQAHSTKVEEELSFFPGQMNTQQYAAELAYTYAVSFIEQMHRRKICTKFDPKHLKDSDSPPIKWLLDCFPVIENIPETYELIMKKEEGLWLPVHFTLAVDTSAFTQPALEDYLTHLDIILKEFGETALKCPVSPLNIAVAQRNPTLQVVKAVATFSPDCVSREDEDGAIPLMHACGNNHSTSVIEFLYQCYPDAIYKRDKFGLGAIHYSSFTGSAAAVRYMLELDPMAAFVTLENGSLPIHDAVQNNSMSISQRLEMIELLLDANPHSTLLADVDGALPLHKAVKHADVEVVRILEERYPEGMYIADNEGLLPIHYYAERQDKSNHLEIIEFILSKNPSSSSVEQHPDAYNASILKSEIEMKKHQAKKRQSTFMGLTWGKSPIMQSPATATVVVRRGSRAGSDGPSASTNNNFNYNNNTPASSVSIRSMSEGDDDDMGYFYCDPTTEFEGQSPSFALRSGSKDENDNFAVKSPNANPLANRSLPPTPATSTLINMPNFSGGNPLNSGGGGGGGGSSSSSSSCSERDGRDGTISPNITGLSISPNGSQSNSSSSGRRPSPGPVYSDSKMFSRGSNPLNGGRGSGKRGANTLSLRTKNTTSPKTITSLAEAGAPPTKFASGDMVGLNLTSAVYEESSTCSPSTSTNSTGSDDVGDLDVGVSVSVQAPAQRRSILGNWG